MHVGSVPWNNESVTVHLEDKWRRILALEIGCSLTLVADFGLPGEKVNTDITLRVEA